MAINKPVKKGTAQTERKSTGLTGYSGGKQINKGKASANKSVGNYSGKTLNLTNKQLGAGGRKAATSDKIAISRTRFDTEKKKVLGPKGKPITGRVDLGGGNIAVYRNGVRVRASSKPSGGGGGGGGGGRGGGGGGPVVDKPPSRRTTDRGPALQAERNPKAGFYPQPISGNFKTLKEYRDSLKPKGAQAKLTPRQIAAARRGEAADNRKGGNTLSGRSATSIRAVGRPASISQGAPKVDYWAGTNKEGLFLPRKGWDKQMIYRNGRRFMWGANSGNTRGSWTEVR